VDWTEVKDIQDEVGCDQEIKEKGRWAAKELAREGVWVFQKLQLFAKITLCS
jgi:hypothetical protein